MREFYNKSAKTEQDDVLQNIKHEFNAKFIFKDSECD